MTSLLFWGGGSLSSDPFSREGVEHLEVDEFDGHIGNGREEEVTPNKQVDRLNATPRSTAHLPREPNRPPEDERRRT